MKTNAIRLLDKFGVPYELRDYAVDVNDLSAETVARKIQLPIEQVFKTLVVKGDRNGVCLAVIPGNSELDLKALAKLSGDRKADLAPLKEIQTLTGYIRGGVTALAGKKEYPVYLDNSCERLSTISISAGVRGTQVLLNPQDYVKVTGATLGSLVKTASGSNA
jgi:Cys-tRNA(Pro)/Cys-tRNA(Cys) deacylase